MTAGVGVPSMKRKCRPRLVVDNVFDNISSLGLPFLFLLKGLLINRTDRRKKSVRMLSADVVLTGFSFFTVC